MASIGLKANYDGSNSRVPTEFKGSSATPEVSGIYSDSVCRSHHRHRPERQLFKRDSGSNKAYTQNGWRTFAANQPTAIGAPCRLSLLRAT